MADNVNITEGSGRTIWCDEVAGPKLAAYTKLADGTADSVETIPGDSNRGLKVNTGPVTRLSVTPTISTSAYAAGDAVGGLMTFSAAARFSGGGLRLRQVVIVDKDQEQAPLDLVLFDRTFTASSDNAAFDPTDADLGNVLTVVPIATYANFSDNAVGVSPQLDLPLKLNGTDLFGQLVNRGAPTYTGTSDLVVILSVIQE